MNPHTTHTLRSAHPLIRPCIHIHNTSAHHRRGQQQIVLVSPVALQRGVPGVERDGVVVVHVARIVVVDVEAAVRAPVVELETKAMRRFAKISQSWRRRLVGTLSVITHIRTFGWTFVSSSILLTNVVVSPGMYSCPSTAGLSTPQKQSSGVSVKFHELR